MRDPHNGFGFCCWFPLTNQNPEPQHKKRHPYLLFESASFHASARTRSSCLGPSQKPTASGPGVLALAARGWPGSPRNWETARGKVLGVLLPRLKEIEKDTGAEQIGDTVPRLSTGHCHIFGSDSLTRLTRLGSLARPQASDDLIQISLPRVFDIQALHLGPGRRRKNHRPAGASWALLMSSIWLESSIDFGLFFSFPCGFKTIESAAGPFFVLPGGFGKWRQFPIFRPPST